MFNNLPASDEVLEDTYAVNEDTSGLDAARWNFDVSHRYDPLRTLSQAISLAILLAVPLSGLAQVDAWRGNHRLLFEPAPLRHALGGVILTIDYGLTEREYYHPQRDRGTLICHYRHRAHADPFLWPGLQDISTWVDFRA